MAKIESFEIHMPQFTCDRKIWVYLPDDYDAKGKPYPVVYMQDGQNLFYKELTLYGDVWRVDETMDRIRETTGRAAIVVGVENGRRRLLEYSPWKTSFKNIVLDEDNAGGRGADYAEFFAENLKTEIDSRYNTARERKGCAVIGSSAGGLITCYIGVKYQSVYETVGLFSAACSFNREELEKFIGGTPQAFPQHALVYAGGKEEFDERIMPAGAMIEDSVRLYKILAARGVSCELILNSDLPHNEGAWAVYFYKFAEDFLRRYYEEQK